MGKCYAPLNVARPKKSFLKLAKVVKTLVFTCKIQAELASSLVCEMEYMGVKAEYKFLYLVCYLFFGLPHEININILNKVEANCA